MFSDLSSGSGHRGPADWDFGPAGAADTEAIAAVRTEAADRLTRDYGRGPWSTAATPDSVLRSMQTSCLLVARHRDAIVGTLRLATRKPWAIDPTRFTPVKAPIYLTDMAVTPEFQHQGVGCRLLEEAAIVARAFPGDAIRLDAYDAPAGAGGFYLKCGFTEKARITYRGTPLIYFERLL